jgi:molybdenum-dependent DNA-binding transcriptional regulator ModE
MPRNYKRHTRKANWTQEDLRHALEFIENGGKIRRAGRQFGIPYGSLQTRIKKIEGRNDSPRMGRRSIFSPEQESSIAEHLKLLSKMFYGLTAKELRRVVFEYAEKNNIKNSFNKNTRLAGKDWYYDFLQRNPTISARKPEATSINRITAFNREELELFFGNLQDLMEKYKFNPSKIFNVDETGITNVQQPLTVLAQKGQKRVGSATSAERGKTVTVICCMSASGTYVPPMFIFPRKRMSLQLQKDGPPDAIYNVSNNGWSNEHLYLIWLRHFAHHVKPSIEEPVLLVLDNHGSHISLEIYEFCRQKGIIMLSIPPHTSHRTQPLDVSFYGPLKTAYKSQCDLFMKTHHFQKISHYDLASIFNKAYSSVAVINKAINGFQATGIYPINPGVFTDEDFLPADTFLQTPQLTNEPNDDITDHNDNNFRSVAIPGPSHSPKASCSKTTDRDMEHSQPGTSQLKVSFEEISPIPTAPSISKQKRSRKQHSEILTSTPKKYLLIEKDKMKAAKLKKKAAPSRKLVQKTKRNVGKEDSDTSSCSENGNSLCNDDSDDDLSGNSNNSLCVVCEEYGKDEIWFRCTVCGRWAHQACSGAETAKNYVCDFCYNKERLKTRRGRLDL